MRNLYILWLVLAFACAGENTDPISPCQPMTISDANPVQFWPIDCATWNESRPPGVHHYCFCQQAQCDDEIKILIDSDEETLIDNVVSRFNSDFDGWTQTAPGGGPSSWAWSADHGGSLKVTTVNTFGTKTLKLITPTPGQPFFVRIKGVMPDFPKLSTSLSISLVIRDASNTLLYTQSNVAVSDYGEFTSDIPIFSESDWATAYSFEITTFSSHYVAGDVVYFTEFSLLHYAPVPYSLIGYNSSDEQIMYIPFVNKVASFIPSDYSICDEEIRLVIANAITSPDLELYKSDCIDVRASHKESLLIEYSNHSNYAGVDYGDLTPDPSFSIRVPAVFFESRFPQEGEDFQTSSNQLIALNSQIKEQRLLSTDRMPRYMHRKMALILDHQFLFIDGEYWIKGGENYEKREKGNKRDSLDMYTCWLTRQNYIVRNIL